MWFESKECLLNTSEMKENQAKREGIENVYFNTHL